MLAYEAKHHSVILHKLIPSFFLPTQLFDRLEYIRNKVSTYGVTKARLYHSFNLNFPATFSDVSVYCVCT